MTFKSATTQGLIEDSEKIFASKIFPDYSFFITLGEGNYKVKYSCFPPNKELVGKYYKGNIATFFINVQKSGDFKHGTELNKALEPLIKYLEENIFINTQFGVTSKVDWVKENEIKVRIDFGEEILAFFDNAIPGVDLELPEHEVYEAP